MRALLLAAAVVALPAYPAPPTIDVRSLNADFVRWNEKGRAVWIQAYRKAEELLKKLERALKGDLAEHERQCFLQEAMRHFIPQSKDGTRFTGEAQGDVTPELMQHVLGKLDQVNRCSPTNRGYLAFHAWKDTGFQEPRQLPSGQKMTMTDFLRAAAAAGVGVGSTGAAPAAAGVGVPVVDPRLVTDPVKGRMPPDGT